MLIDISGNSFRSLGNPTQFTLPTVTYNPKQIYGNDLYLWVDLTDWRNMYNTSGGSANISSIGCVPATSATDPSNHTSVRRMEDMAGNFTGSNNSRKFYFYGNTTGVGTLQPDSSVTGNTNLFCNGQWDTNKGVFSGIAGNFDLRHPVTFSNPINFLAPRSAITLCNYLFLTDFTSIGGNNYTKGIVVPGPLFAVPAFGFFNPNLTTNLALNINSLTQWSGNWTTAYTQFNDRTVMLTAVLSGRGFSIYANTTLITSGTLTSGVTYPISGLSNNYIAFGRSEQASLFSAYQRVRPIWEGFIANAYTSPQQINLLYDYFRVKFKDRIGDLF